MQSEQNEKKTKQAYEKPRLRMIELAAEEVLSLGCKTFQADPIGVLGNGCLVSSCSTVPGS